MTSVLSILLVSAGCDGGATVAADGGSDAATAIDSSVIPGDSGSPDDGGSDAGRRPDAAAESTGEVHWVTEVEPTTVEGDVGYDYAFMYELAITGDPFVYSLTLELCVQIAGMAEECFPPDPLSNLPGTGYRRFGVDPSMYAVGENHYRFHLTLSRGAEVVSEDTLDLQYDVVSCSMCVGADAP